MKKLLAGTAALAVLAAAGTASAADLGPYGAVPAPASPPPPAMWGWELRAGVLAHDPTSPEKGSADLNGELLFPKFWHAPDPFWDQFVPHAAVGFTANFAGKTSQVYAGPAWNFDLPYRFFFSGEIGPGANNGKTGENVPPDRSKVGCNWWFHESASIGYHLTETWSVMGTVEHSSNAGLCKENRGVTNYGLRIGYQF